MIKKDVSGYFLFSYQLFFLCVVSMEPHKSNLNVNLIHLDHSNQNYFSEYTKDRAFLSRHIVRRSFCIEQQWYYLMANDENGIYEIFIGCSHTHRSDCFRGCYFWKTACVYMNIQTRTHERARLCGMSDFFYWNKWQWIFRSCLRLGAKINRPTEELLWAIITAR